MFLKYGKSNISTDGVVFLFVSFLNYDGCCCSVVASLNVWAMAFKKK